MVRKFFLLVAMIVGFCHFAVSETSNEVKQLETKIIELRKSFWQDGKRKVTDQEYDQLVKKLSELSPSSFLLKKGQEKLLKTPNPQVKHSQPMRSLRKCYQKQQLIAWCKQVSRTPNEKFTVEPKYDGVAVEFNNGVLSTRGNGDFGANISKISDILRYFPKKPQVRAVGELLLSDVMFRKLQKIDHKYVSSRHAVVGMLSSSDVTFWQKHGIVFDFVCYSYVQKEFNRSQLQQNWERVVKWVKKIGYLTDGCVVKVADSTYFKSLGVTQAYPKGAMAFKWGCERKWTKLLKVTWQQGKNGFSPVGELAEINLDGKCVKKVSLYNLNYIRKHRLTLGSTLQIECVGGTVPVVKDCRVLANGRKIELVNCPECHQPVQLIKGAYRCSNKECRSKVVMEVYSKLKKKGVKGFGKKTVLGLVTTLDLKSWADLQGKTLVELETVKGVGHQKAIALKKALK